MIKTTSARLCCDTDVGALGINIVGFFDEAKVFLSGVVLPSNPRDVHEILYSLINSRRMDETIDPEKASIAYVKEGGAGLLGKDMVCEVVPFQGGLLRKIYLRNSKRFIGYILDGIKNYIPRISGYADSVRGFRQGKENNDDAVMVSSISFCQGGVEKTIYVATIADGVSSLGSGLKASSLALRLFLSELASTAYLDQFVDLGDINKIYVKTAEELIRRNQAENKMTATTFTAVVYPVNGLLIVVHVGDTRAYIVKNNRIIRLTEDHKVPGTTTITRSLGIARHDPQIVGVHFEPGSTIILASDGLYEVVDEEEMISAINKLRVPSLIVKDLIRKVIKRQGRDDATTGVIRRIL